MSAPIYDAHTFWELLERRVTDSGDQPMLIDEADRIAAACQANDVAFNWGAMRRHHDGFKKLRDALLDGAIGELRYAQMYSYTDLIKHHPHTLDLVAMLLGDSAPRWAEGRLVQKGEPLAANYDQRPRAYPAYDADRHAFLPPAGEEIADPMVCLLYTSPSPRD